MLEGPLSPLFRLIRDALAGRGITVTRINLCPGDRAAWGRAPALTFRGRRADWPAFVGDVMERAAVDTVLMHSERRPYHLEAAAEARRRGIPVAVSELGYLRPDWMTLECNGNSVDSLFPTDPAAITALAREAPPVSRAVVYPREAGLETTDELRNSLPNVFLWFLTPHYRAHGLYHPFAAYARFLAREARAGARKRVAQAVRADVRPPFFVFAMQTDTDFQIRSNAHVADMAEALGIVFASFAAHAPAEARLVVKKHPGDLSPVHWAARVPDIAARHSLSDRLLFADGLGMADWLADAAGLVTVNSSAGLDALQAGVPLHAMAPAIYDVPGLTHQGPLDAFWFAPPSPDPALYDAFERALAASIQLRGTIYSRAGTRAAAAAMAERIATGTVGVPGATEGPPPRHVKARALGIR